MKTTIMKNKYIHITAVVCGVLIGMTSCNDNKFLEVDQYNIIGKDAMFANDANAKKGLNGVYDMLFPNDSYGPDWGFKPNLFTGCHPTIDTQATLDDKDWNTQNWNQSDGNLLNGWKHVYAGICRANDYLAGLEKAEAVSSGAKKSLEGEGRALRAFFFHWLATTFGRVPMLSTGENYINTPYKARAETYVEMWDFIIDDFRAAADLLDWQPMDGQYGRATKGMALTYLGDAYMWKAYRLTNGANGQKQDEAEAKKCYQEAEKCFAEVLKNGPYKLNDSFTTLWDPASAWGPEAIWVEQLDEGNNWGKWDNLTSKLMLKWFTACPENGGWGSLYLSWEWWSSFERGDKRREGSACTGAVPQIDPNNEKYDPQYKDWYVASVYGRNPYLQEVLGKGNPGTKTKQFHFTNGQFAPAIWSTKFWRTASADYKAWGDGHWSPTPIYWKRLPNVMLDYAECRFRLYGGDDAEAWKQIDLLRERAFGLHENGKEKALTEKYLPYYNQFAEWTERTHNPNSDNENDRIFQKTRSEYPIPFGSYPGINKAPDAKAFYTAFKTKQGLKSPLWKVAVNTERRKEFNCEWSLRPDMQKSGFMEDHVEHDYPMRETPNDKMADTPWTNRNYKYNDLKMDMPIPHDEILKNPLCDQNAAYTKHETNK
ncbi:RagB/SusD family nutrient uptake outer membrane protein [Hallella bergensis]|uniref:RagB/SusD family nutrient uptake outer membrane protein n=1 Tax=Hallella bergensis TaxID=242750 RepID=UPI0039906A83